MPHDRKTTKDWQKIAEQEQPIDSAEVSDDVDEDEELEPATTTVGTGGILEHPSYKALQDKLTQEEAFSLEQRDKATRAIAELENLRRRTDEQIKKTHKYALEQFANALLPVVDSLEQALQCAGNPATDSMQQMTQGIELTLKLFVDVLAKFEVKQVDPLGEPFNPQLHEAMVTQPDPTVPSGTVITVFQKGYLLHDRLIRPARVIVAKN